MPSTYTNLLYHIVFSTKDRIPLIANDFEEELYRYIGGIIRRCGGDLLAANSVADHIHLLFPLPRTITIADLVKEIKTGATKWIHEMDARRAVWPGNWQRKPGLAAARVRRRSMARRLTLRITSSG